MGYGQVYNSELTSNSSAALEPLGTLRVEPDGTNGRGKAYRYVAVASDTTVANGTVLYYTDDTFTTVTSDISDSFQNKVAGVGIGAITASYYGWIQTGGSHSAVKTDGGDDIVDGDNIIGHATTDGVCDRMAAGTAPTHRPLGIATDDDVDASDTVEAFLLLDPV